MKSRERILNTFRGLPTDRTPVSPFIWINFINEFFQVSHTLADEAVDGLLHQIYRHFGFDSMVRTCTFDMVSPAIATSADWQVTIDEQQPDGKKRIVTTTIRTPERTMRGVTEHALVNAYTEISAETEHFIKDERDFAQFVKYQPPVPVFDCSRVARTRAMLGEEGVVAPWLPSVFNTLSRLRKLDDLICDALDEPAFFQSMMEYYCVRTIEAGVQLAKVSDIVTYEENIANGSIVGPDYFQEHLLPYERRCVDALKASGALVLLHNCGDCDNMYGVYNQMGIDALETLTPPPFGNANVGRAIASLKPEMAVLGNIDQIEFLTTAAPQAVYERARSLIGELRPRGRFVLATSDYLSNGTPHENLAALVQASIDCA